MQLLPLTSLRFFAAFAVVLFHMQELPDVQRNGLLWRAMGEGHLGVSFFFVLSGFILTYSYIGRFQTFSGRELVRFGVARVARIVPVHWLTLLASLPLVWAAVQREPIDSALVFVLNALLLHTWIPVIDIATSYNRVSWSLVNEMAFYSILPFLLLLWSRAARVVSLRWPVLLATFAWVMVLGIEISLRDMPVQQALWAFYLNPAFRLVDFFVGYVLALVFLHRRPARQRLDAKRPSLRLGATVAESIAVGLLGWAIWYAPQIPLTVRLSAWYMPMMVLVIYVFARGGGVLSRLLSTRGLVYLGEVSFCVYMVHQLVIRYWIAADLPSSSAWTVVALALITVVVSMVLHQVYERPLRTRIRRAGDRMADRIADAPPRHRQSRGAAPRA